jgi:hypothetical protein
MSLLPESVNKIRLVNRPIAVPYNYRIMYKLAQMVLIFGNCCGNKGCSMQKLQMISLGLSAKDEMDNLLAYVNGTNQYPVIRFDPSVNRAILFGLAEQIVLRQANGLFRLTAKGKTFLDEITGDNQLLILEKDSLRQLTTRLTEDMIKNIMADWRTYDV